MTLTESECAARRQRLAELEAAYDAAISGGSQSMSYAGKSFTNYRAEPRLLTVEIARLKRELNEACGGCYAIGGQRVVTLFPLS